ncbi:MAG TPA: diacylglycerol kinase family protein [Elusimicrobiota bacterium]|nr:diacylglycerol kinase family protein [Elusimicrobiota bacterium]
MKPRSLALAAAGAPMSPGCEALFIVNPAAGHGRGRARWERGRELAESLWPGLQVAMTQRPGHGRELARAAALGGTELVVAVGGDGTLGEVVDGYLAAPETSRRRAVVATFPAGSGCDFARHVGVPRDPQAWAAAMAAGTRTRLDAALATFRAPDGAPRARHFLNVAALGLAGDVAAGVERRGKFLGGTLTYLLEGLLSIASARPKRMRLVVDGVAEPAAEYHLVAAANTSTIGGGMKLAPGADERDGLLEVLTVGALSKGELLRLMPAIYAGGHVGAPGVVLRRARRLEIHSDEVLPLNIDGDLDGRAPAVFEVQPKALPFLL